MTEPSDARDYAADQLIDVLRSLMGQRVASVGYRVGSEFAASDDYIGPVLVHSVDHAVVISTETSGMVLEWGLRNYDEWLNIAIAPDMGLSAAVPRLLNVTVLPKWRAVAGAVITGFGVAVQRSDSGRELPWSVRIVFDGGSSVVVALGEVCDEAPSYQPDNLVVIFDPEVAQAYQILDSAESAWGRDIPS